jgi:hypothetical protein
MYLSLPVNKRLPGSVLFGNVETLAIWSVVIKLRVPYCNGTEKRIQLCAMPK